MDKILVLPERLTIDVVESLHIQAGGCQPGWLDGTVVAVVDGAGAQWLASAVATGWSVRATSQGLEQGLALLGLSHVFSPRG